MRAAAAAASVAAHIKSSVSVRMGDTLLFLGYGFRLICSGSAYSLKYE